MLAEQEFGEVVWRHADPLTGSRAASRADGLLWRTAEAEPLGADVGTEDPFLHPEPPDSGFAPDPVMPLVGGGGCRAGDPTCVRCTLDGVEVSCGRVAHLVDVGAADPCPNNDCGVQALEGTLWVNGRVVGRDTRLATARDLAAFGGGTLLRYATTGGWAVPGLAGGLLELLRGDGGAAERRRHLGGWGLRLSTAQEPHKPSMDPFSIIDYEIKTNVKIVRADNGNIHECNDAFGKAGPSRKS